MTREEIIRLARQAGCLVASSSLWFAESEALERFVALVAAAEREACAAEIAALRNANEAFARRQEWWDDRMVAINVAVQDEREACAKLAERGMGDWLLGKKVANAIRARGQE